MWLAAVVPVLIMTVAMLLELVEQRMLRRAGNTPLRLTRPPR